MAGEAAVKVGSPEATPGRRAPSFSLTTMEPGKRRPEHQARNKPHGGPGEHSSHPLHSH